VLGVAPEHVFVNDTLADGKKVRFYFNAGSFVVRPEAGLMQAWAHGFQNLYQDSEIADSCQEGPHNVFLHQAALAAVAVRQLRESETVRIPDTYSYPLFFEKYHGGSMVFDSLQDVVTMRCEFQGQDLPQGWEQDVQGPPEVLSWIKAKLESKGD
jgi:hypothetical protein